MALTTRIVLVGGLDPGTGAGVTRDLLTATALGVSGLVIGTAWTEQNSAGPLVIEPRAPDRVQVALVAALGKIGLAGSVKIGMVATASIAQAILEVLVSYPGPVVFDPVLRASSGGLLYQDDRESILALARRTSLLSPNLYETAWLLDKEVRTLADARKAARELTALGIPAVLIKGGHLEGDATDVLLWSEGERLFSSPRIAGISPRGTGCTLATAIAVGLAHGESLEDAVATAKTWLTQRIEQATTIGDERHL
jgi:hydroxymethylpyrimidine/phosphomethylpyrimidine kinase